MKEDLAYQKLLQESQMTLQGPSLRARRHVPCLRGVERGQSEKERTRLIVSEKATPVPSLAPPSSRQTAAQLDLSCVLTVTDSIPLLRVARPVARGYSPAVYSVERTDVSSVSNFPV